ncbi:MAG: penicillin-binding protein 2, partial [Pseudomonadota bacterium]
MRAGDSPDTMFDRRAAIAAGFGGLIFSGLIARLFQLQIMEYERYEVAAKENGIRSVLAPPRRGDILDRHGQLLATHRNAGRVSIVREQAGDMEEVLKQVARLIELSPERQQAV